MFLSVLGKQTQYGIYNSIVHAINFLRYAQAHPPSGAFPENGPVLFYTESNLPRKWRGKMGTNDVRGYKEHHEKIHLPIW